MDSTSNNFSIHRYPLTGMDDQYCGSCDQTKRKGYWMFCPPLMGPQAVFVCDDCLAAARKHKFVTNGKPKQNTQ